MSEKRVLIHTEDVRRHYRLGDETVRALDGITTDIYEGEFLSIMGPSGSGKSTFFNMLGGLDRPTSGTIFMNGQDVSKLSERQQAFLRCHNIGYIFQTFNLVSVLTAHENVMLSLQIRGGSARDIRKDAVDRLDEVGLADFMHHRPDKLSGGQRQRVAIARALVTKPLLILADEPTANLDHETARSIIELMKELNEKEKVTFVFSTHDPAITKYATSLYRLKDGLLQN